MIVTKGLPGADVVPALENFAIEVGNDGNQEVSGIVAPKVFEQANQLFV